jgi:hypothetical protein
VIEIDALHRLATCQSLNIFLPSVHLSCCSTGCNKKLKEKKMVFVFVILLDCKPLKCQEVNWHYVYKTCQHKSMQVAVCVCVCVCVCTQVGNTHLSFIQKHWQMTRFTSILNFFHALTVENIFTILLLWWLCRQKHYILCLHASHNRCFCSHASWVEWPYPQKTVYFAPN